MSDHTYGRLIYRCERCGAFFHGADYGQHYGPKVRLKWKVDPYHRTEYLGVEPSNTMVGQKLRREELHQCAGDAQGIGTLVGMGALPTAPDTVDQS